MEQTVARGVFDRYARMVRRALDVPTAIVTLVEADRQVLVGLDGLGSPWAETRETPLTHSVCQYVVRDRAPLVIGDTHQVDFLAGNLALPELGVVAYAGWPVTDHTGRVVGALAAIEPTARAWTADDLTALEDIAAACSAELGERLLRTTAVADLEESENYGERGRVLLSLSEALSSTRSIADIAMAIKQLTIRQLGCLQAGMWLLPDLADLAEQPDPRSVIGRTLTWVRDSPATLWPTAEGHHELPADESNPVGASLVRGESLFLVDRAAQDALFPQLASSDSVGEARAFLPLVVGNRPFGVLVLTWPEAEQFDAEHRVTLAALSDYTAQAVQRAALLEEREGVSVTLQRAMLTDLPEVSGVELAARYLPAATREQVGGDWYDAVPLPSGDLVVAVGDVVGHDIVAATMMGQLRSMLRAIVCTHDVPPSRSLELLDRVAPRVGVETITSALVVRLTPLGGRWRVTWSRAGHLPAVVAGPGRDARLLSDDEVAHDGLLGVGADVRRTDTVVDVDAGSVLLLYTDGLVERRGESLDVGLQRLRVAVDDARAPLLDLLADVLAAQLGSQAPEDDVVVLAVRLG